MCASLCFMDTWLDFGAYEKNDHEFVHKHSANMYNILS